ncbi:hypothetical protein [Clostridium algidicarnis]|uniref:hypothetical protein n=1 Tax=Clostridium algidicarnis TaxID=37659 RepID=UPI001C0D4F0C|nr:hypothetical protein [Clostridium algidicarnis]MBU3210559.1 hypothetical protein [Clostridium algidicarnis]MBU3228217.1 hypothetical protein [Clostridium algidicarnis]MBU3252101.1 hypothetical protein [Clostridium algidicarnis]
MFKCMNCGEKIKKIKSIGLEVGNFILKDQEENKAKILFAFGNKKIGNLESKDGYLEETYYCEKCNKAFL